MNEPAVVVCGAGPTGLMLAGELALAGVDVVIIERRASQELVGARARGLHARTLEVLDQRGIVDRFIARGTVHPIGPGFSMIPLSIEDFPTRHNYVLGLEQRFIECIMADWVRELKVPVHYGVEVTGFAQNDDAVEVRLLDGRSLRAAYLVGCDGGRSLIRKTAGIAFPGTDPTTSNIIAEVEFAQEPAEWGLRRDAIGIHSLSKSEDGRRVHVLVTELKVENIRREPTLHDLSAALIAVYGSDFGAHDPTLLTRFTDATRQAASYRERRVLLAGDSAHIHPPDGGQGVQLGILDAVNLGWKLALVVKRVCPDTLLDTYQAERHPAAARILRATLASVALRREDERTSALRETMTELLRLVQPRRQIVGLLSGLDIHYELGEGHPLLGRRIPDLDITTREGPVRLYTLLHGARPLVLNLGPPGSVDLAPWADRVRVMDAVYTGTWELPVIGTIPPPIAVLIRPDGYVAWVGDSTQVALLEAAARWFGPPAGAG